MKTRVLLVSCWMVAGWVAGAGNAHAQNTHTPVRGVDITGLELGLEGSRTAVRGAEVSWLLTTHEVVGLDRLRPAQNARISIATSYARGTPVFEGTTDAFGRAEARFTVPEDAPEQIGIVIDLVGRGARRRFELSLATIDALSMEVSFVRARVAPRQRAGVFGRLFDRRTRRPVANTDVRLELSDQLGRPVARPTSVRTDRAGFFMQNFRAPRGVSALELRARMVNGTKTRAEATTSIAVGPEETPALRVQMAPEKTWVRPGESIAVEVIVRRPNGSPIAGATLEPSWTSAPAPSDPRRRIRTDARGRAAIRFTAENISEIEDRVLSVNARKEGIGAGAGSTQVRIAGMRYAGALAAEGGAFPEAIGGKIFVRVVGADGKPAAAGVPVSLTGPRLPEGLSGVTDADGVATFEVSLRPAAGEESDLCGGSTATRVEAEIGASEGSVEGCVPVDPDGVVRVRIAQPRIRVPSVPQAGCLDPQVEITRAPAASGLPVAVTWLVRDDTGPLRPLMTRVLEPNQSTIAPCLPADAVGHVVIRARPLYGPERLEVRGGSASMWVTPGDRLALATSLEGDAVCLQPQGARSVAVAVLPIDEARALVNQARARLEGFLPDLRTPPDEAHDALIAAALALVTPFDLGAPAVLRGRTIVDTPAPADPESIGLLRDPWRSRARFVAGRLGLVFQALENHIDASVPERIEEVAVQENGRWQFNALVLDAVSHSETLGDAGATGLGGEALTIAQLMRLDPELTYDNVARRVTRKRLFSLILAMREFVRQRGLDLRWSNRSDPAEWLSQLPNTTLQTLGMDAPAPRQLVDGWGRPFVIQETRGRSRFSLVEPVAGVEIVSAGPDGRVGNSDDVFDPTARVLSERSLYGRAVGEDILLARLRGVELGRATAELVTGLFGQALPDVPTPDEEDATAGLFETWTALPSVLDPDPEPLGIRPIGEPLESELRISRTEENSCTSSELLASSAAPATWGVVAFGGDEGGATQLAFSYGTRGAPLLVHGPLPDRLREGEPARLSLELTNFDRAFHNVEIHVETSDGLSVSAPSTIAIPAEETRSIALTLEGHRVGAHDLKVRLRRAGLPEEITRAQAIEVDRGLHPVTERASAFAWEDRILDTALRAAEGDALAEGRLVLTAPGAIGADPEFSTILRRDPALIAWSTAASGRPIEDDLRARLLRAQVAHGGFEGEVPALSTAAALLALSSLGADDPEAVTAFERAKTVIEPLLPQDNTNLAAQAAVVAALAFSGAPEAADDLESQVDPLAVVLSRLRGNLRASLRRDRSEPTLLARASAALLTADPADAHGLAMLDLVSAHLESTRVGARVVTTTSRASEAEHLVATAALAVAAHQAGRDALARRLAGEALLRTDVAARIGGEPAFWTFALSAYGVLGAAEPESVRVTIDGREQVVPLEQGRASLPLDPRAAHSVQVRAFGDAGVIARAEIDSFRSFSERQDAPLRIALGGDPGRIGGVAALELGIAAIAAVDRPIVEIQLPAGVRADERLLTAIRAAHGVTQASAREPGWICIVLARTEAEQQVLVPLPLEWNVAGRLLGLGAVAYAEDIPERRTVLPPRVWDIASGSTTDSPSR